MKFLQTIEITSQINIIIIYLYRLKLKSQLDSVVSDSQAQVNEKVQAISDLQKEKLTFSQMIEESNRHVSQLKQVNQ